MGDWIGLGVIVLVVLGALFGLSYLGRPQERLTEEEYERRVQESRGTMTAGVAGLMYALQKLMNPKAAEAVEVQRDLKAGYYDDASEQGEGKRPEGKSEEATGAGDRPAAKLEGPELKEEEGDEKDA